MGSERGGQQAQASQRLPPPQSLSSLSLQVPRLCWGDGGGHCPHPSLREQAGLRPTPLLLLPGLLPGHQLSGQQGLFENISSRGGCQKEGQGGREGGRREGRLTATSDTSNAARKRSVLLSSVGNPQARKTGCLRFPPETRK